MVLGGSGDKWRAEIGGVEGMAWLLLAPIAIGAHENRQGEGENPWI